MNDDNPLLLTYQDIAQRSGLALATVVQYRKRGTLPPPDLRLDNKPLWKAETVQAWLEARESVEVVYGGAS